MSLIAAPATTCPHCHGTRRDEDLGPCTTCNGSGEIRMVVPRAVLLPIQIIVHPEHGPYEIYLN